MGKDVIATANVLVASLDLTMATPFAVEQLAG